MSCDPMGSRFCLLKYWAQTPQDKHVCLIAACIPDQYTDSRARRILVYAPWSALFIFRNISGRADVGTIT